MMNCNEFCQLLSNYVSSNTDPLYAILPKTFGEYFKSITTAARGAYRRAVKTGCRVKQISLITPELHQDICEIFRSKPVRQHREVCHIYDILGNGTHDIFTSWPISKYGIQNCPKHYWDFWGCFIKDKLVAYIELIQSNRVASVHHTLGHGDYLKKGIMKYLFIEVVKSKIGILDYLHYGNYETKKYDWFFFRNDLGIINHGGAKMLYAAARGEL